MSRMELAMLLSWANCAWLSSCHSSRTTMSTVKKLLHHGLRIASLHEALELGKLLHHLHGVCARHSNRAGGVIRRLRHWSPLLRAA